MEEILRKLQKEASGSKQKTIRDACGVAYGKMHLSVYEASDSNVWIAVEFTDLNIHLT